MNLAHLNYDDLLFILKNVREDDKREIYATKWNEDPEAIARKLLAQGNFAWIAGTDHPIAATGCAPVWPGVWTAWMIATDEFYLIGKPLTKFVRRVIMPALKESGAHRVETCSIEGRDIAHRWLKFFGAECECELKKFGKNQETFKVYTWFP